MSRCYHTAAHGTLRIAFAAVILFGVAAIIIAASEEHDAAAALLKPLLMQLNMTHAVSHRRFLTIRARIAMPTILLSAISQCSM